MEKSRYGKYIVTELKTPKFTSEAVASYAEFATRISDHESRVRSIRHRR